ncbi:hypothetical protein RhiTH_009027 [Rhizoctonia solani]
MFPVGRDSHELSQFLHTHSKSSIMGKFYDSIPESFIPWINEQHCFWVATAPISANGHVNVSPKGMTGIVHELGSPRYEELIPLSDRLPGSRAAIEVQIHKVGSSCGYSVPFYEYTGERTLLCDVMRPREQRDADGCPEELKSGKCLIRNTHSRRQTYQYHSYGSICPPQADSSVSTFRRLGAGEELA